MEGKLTLDEMAQLAEKVTFWVRGGHYAYECRNKRNNYAGEYIVEDTRLDISCGLSGVFPWEKIARVRIWTKAKTEPSEEVVYEEGTHIYPLYQRIKILAEKSIIEYERERKRDKTKEIDQACEEVRKKYLGGRE